MKNNIDTSELYDQVMSGSDDVARYVCQVNSLTLIRHLNLLIIASQKHRGAGLALLGGDTTFEPRISALQKQIDWSLAVIGSFNQQFGQLVKGEDWQSIEHDWQALIDDWREDSVITCFEFHSHFIETLIKLMWNITSGSNYFSCVPKMALHELSSEHASTQSGMDGAGVAATRSDHQVLIQITIRLMPELIETIAKLRGIATHASVCGYCDNEHQLRLTYLLQSLNAQKEKLVILSKSIRHDSLTKLPALVEILLHEHKLDQLQAMVRQEIISRENITIKSQNIFDFATSIIDIYYKVIEDGIDYFQHKLEEAFA